MGAPILFAQRVEQIAPRVFARHDAPRQRRARLRVILRSAMLHLTTHTDDQNLEVPNAYHCLGYQLGLVIRGTHLCHWQRVIGCISLTSAPPHAESTAHRLTPLYIS